jgi:mutator protein MutT
MCTIEVAAGLIFHRGRLLITQRYAEAHLGGLWEFPGGKREAEESFEDCLKRELREELGIEVSVHEPIDTVLWSYREKNVLLKFFRCTWLANQPQALGCPAFAWITPNQLEEFCFPPADQKLIGMLQQRSDLWQR